MPIRASETSKSNDERQEDDEEHYVGSNRADEIDEAHEAHEDEKEGETGVELIGVLVRRYGVERWREGGSEAEPEGR